MSTSTLAAPSPYTDQARTPAITVPYTLTVRGGLLASAEFTAKNDLVTPILNSLHLSASGVVVTDRYMASLFEFDTSAPFETGAGAVLVPGVPFAKWLKALPLPDTVNASLVFTDVSAELVREDGSVVASIVWEPRTGNFPPIKRLFPEIMSDTITPLDISAMLVGRMITAVKHFLPAVKVQKPKTKEVVIGLSQGASASENGKPAPVLVTVRELPAGAFRVLIQPRLLTP